MADARPVRVVVAGGGIAAVELLLALRSVARDAVRATVVSPRPSLHLRPESVSEPFTQASRHYDLQALTTALGAELVTGAVRAVKPGEKVVDLGERELPYDELVLAPGARTEAAVAHATTFTAEHADDLHWTVRELEDGTVRHVVFVAPPGSYWTLPLYELALMSARRAAGMDAEGGAVTVVTHESAPLEVFRGAGSAAVASLLEDAGVRVLTGRTVASRESHALVLHGDERLPADRVVALPRLYGPPIQGLPLDEHGFVRVDPSFAVEGVADVHAIGDGAAYPLKQGGLATQQADAVATVIARRAGLDVPELAFAGRLRATLWTGEAPLYLSGRVEGGEIVDTQVSHRSPWWPAQKVAGARLAPFLADVDELGLEQAVARIPAGVADPEAEHRILASEGDPGVELLGGDED
ncbi:FAD-dependent oxidoreductase [Patulibacter sp. SYSU D01012]|uniref:NAD(P)/FAD-dependent oxidoreductase n=1 Tax=Patulibacter sp. SYSU D01012 TaxID=2817381 RepID=UPI001B30DAB8|nr:FAD-dependent oxidoreductase [Patulibacter sp. SYSU D01012]